MSIDLKISFKGFDELKESMRELVLDVDKSFKRAITREAEELIGDSKEITPVDTGRLRASGYVKQPDGDGSVEAGFDTEYALAVHENLTAFHPSGQAKYLETPFLARASSAEARIADYVAREAGLK